MKHFIDLYKEFALNIHKKMYTVVSSEARQKKNRECQRKIYDILNHQSSNTGSAEYV
jgi:hypothetical protein